MIIVTFVINRGRRPSVFYIYMSNTASSQCVFSGFWLTYE